MGPELVAVRALWVEPVWGGMFFHIYTTTRSRRRRPSAGEDGPNCSLYFPLYLCLYVRVYGFTWIYMDLHGFAWMYMDLHGFGWICMDLGADFPQGEK